MLVKARGFRFFVFCPGQVFTTFVFQLRFNFERVRK